MANRKTVSEDMWYPTMSEGKRGVVLSEYTTQNGETIYSLIGGWKNNRGEISENWGFRDDREKRAPLAPQLGDRNTAILALRYLLRKLENGYIEERPQTPASAPTQGGLPF